MRSPKGLSLVEILVSLAIIGVVIGALAGSMVGNLRISSRSNQQSLAVEYVNGVLEQYRIHWKSSANYAAATNPPGLSSLNARLPSDFSVTLRADNLNLDGSISATNPPPLRRITITVTRNGRVLARGATLIGNPAN